MICNLPRGDACVFIWALEMKGQFLSVHTQTCLVDSIVLVYNVWPELHYVINKILMYSGFWDSDLNNVNKITITTPRATQRSAAITHSNITLCCIQRCSNWEKTWLEVEVAKDTHTWPSRAGMGRLFVRICETMDCVITVPHCIVLCVLVLKWAPTVFEQIYPGNWCELA